MTPEEHVRAGIAPDIRHWMYDGAYLEMLEKIDPSLYAGIKCVVELGARDCYDSIHLANFFKCPVHAFEANPDAVKFCREHTADRSDITVHPYAVGNVDGKIKFHPVNLDKYRNIGASSIFKFDMNEQIQPPEVLEAGEEIQTEIEVDCVRLDSRDINPDAIFMDIQGAELMALEGLGDKINDVRIVALETQYHSCYLGGPTFYEIDSFLNEKGFKIAWCKQTGNDQAPEVPNPPREFWFDLLYVKA
jgi:FkbM family methyltransferase